MSSIEHLNQQLGERKEQYDRLSKRIRLLRRAYAVETDVERRFQQETNLEVLENNRDILNNEIIDLESKIRTVEEVSKKYKSPKGYLEYQILKSYEFLVGLQKSDAASLRSRATDQDPIVSKYRSAIDLWLRVYFQLCANLQSPPTNQIKAIADELQRQSPTKSRPADEPIDRSQIFTKLPGTRIVTVVVSQLFRIADLLTQPESVKAQRFHEALTNKDKARRALNRRTAFRLGSLGTLRPVTSSTDKYDRFWGPARPAFASPTTQSLHFIPYELTLSEQLKSLQSEFEPVLESALISHSDTIMNSQITSGHLRIYPAGIGVISLGLTLKFVEAVHVEVVAQIAKNIEALLFVDPEGSKKPYDALMLDIVDQVTKHLFTSEALDDYERRWIPPSTTFVFRDQGLVPLDSVNDLAYLMSLAPDNHENFHDLKLRVELALRLPHWTKDHAIAVAGEGVGLFFVGKPATKERTKNLLKWLSETHELVSAGAYAEQAFAEEIEKIYDQRLLDDTWLAVESDKLRYLGSLLATMQQVVRATASIRTHLQSQGTGILTNYAKDVWTYSNPVNKHRSHLGRGLKYIADWLEEHQKTKPIPDLARLLETVETLNKMPSPFPNLPRLSGVVRASPYQEELEERILDQLMEFDEMLSTRDLERGNDDFDRRSQIFEQLRLQLAI
ncbi:MAG TPA: hypothetical protein VFI24_02790 [Pyrinomonadaceae bacterium]|nr:hypothetical protein [Pyrinomonadaceae bacterium]